MKWTPEQKREEILRYMDEIQKTEYAAINSIELLLKYGFQLAQWQAFAGEAKAEAKQILLKKRQAYLKQAVTDMRGAPPMILKDYINDLAADESAYLELCDRCNSACTHTIDLVRTAVSALKTEQNIQNFSNNR